jgi:hypothetical protein
MSKSRNRGRKGAPQIFERTAVRFETVEMPLRDFQIGCEMACRSVAHQFAKASHVHGQLTVPRRAIIAT